MRKIITALKKKKLTLSLAESCTGGYASYLLTKPAGASKVFKGGLTVYSLDAKKKLLGLPWSLLNKSQGVSKEVAALLACAVRKKLKTDIGASIVGFAGPTGKKVGTTYIALATKKDVVAIEAIIKGSRDKIRERSSQLLIDLISKKT